MKSACPQWQAWEGELGWGMVAGWARNTPLSHTTEEVKSPQGANNATPGRLGTTPQYTAGKAQAGAVGGWGQVTRQVGEKGHVNGQRGR